MGTKAFTSFFVKISLSLIVFAISISKPASSLPINGSTRDLGLGPLFSSPHVFLTLSSVAGTDSDSDDYLDTMIELNWYNLKSIWETSASHFVGLFSTQPVNGQILVPTFSVEVLNASAAERGYMKTSIRFGRPDINSDDEHASDNCLGFWIAYYKRDPETGLSTIESMNCFRKYPRWMNNLKDIIGNRPLSLMMIPGTHDAGAIREYDGLGSENPFVKYSVTQEEQLYRQFVHGIRYVDIRVAHYPDTEEKFWINHGSVRFQPLITLFSAIKRFVDETGEIIFMDFHGFPVGFDNDLLVHNDLLQFVLREMGDYLLHEGTVPSNPTPNDVWAKNRTVILTYQYAPIQEQFGFLWPYLVHAWGDKNEVDPLEQYFANEALPRYGCSGSWWSAMAEMTPTPEDVILFPFRGLRGMAQMVNVPLTFWWMRESWYSRSHIVSTDFFLGNNIIEMAVHVNKEGGVCPN